MRTFVLINQKKLKEPKPKLCKHCGNQFFPMRSFQTWCSSDCGFELAKKKKELKDRKQNAVDKKTWHLLNDKLSTFENKLQSEINAIARAVDYGQPCIATNSYNGKKNGGHYISVGSNSSLRYNLHNIHLQSEHSNKWKAGDTLRYRVGIIERYGQKYMDFMDNLQSLGAIKLTREDILRIIPIAKKIRKSLESNLIERTAEQRIQLRNEINTEIGIYKTNF